MTRRLPRSADCVPSGRRLILVTGRELPDLLTVFPHIALFDRVVAENGAVVHCPATREEKLLGEPPPAPFVRALRERGVSPIAVGRVIVATWKPHETTVLEVIRDLGLELHVTFNKEAVMVLPAGLSKATGLAEALRELGLSAHNVVGVGDAENDHAFLRLSECRVAVSNALPMLKDAADLVTRGEEGAGVRELIERLLADDLRDLEPIGRHGILLGVRTDGSEVVLQPQGTSVLLVGSSGSGKSRLAAGLLERLAECEYQFCVVDPEGDYTELPEAIVLGDSQREPSVAEVLDVLAKPGENVVVNLLGTEVERRPAFFHALLPELQELRAATGRPHWIVVDEAHHLLPAASAVAALTLPRELDGIHFVTVHPQLMAASALSAIDLIIAVGRAPENLIHAWSATLGLQPAGLETTTLEPGEALAWRRGDDSPAFRFQMASPRGVRRRHQRKYAEGKIPDYHSFYFRGPHGKLNLRAQNLNLFLQLADGVDDATWMHHLRRGDYSRWFRDVIRDEDLAAEASRVERDPHLDAQATRAAIHAAVEQRYTHPA